MTQYNTFLSKASVRFKNKFIYYISNTVIKPNTSIEVQCPFHGSSYQTVKTHLESKYGCPTCSKIALVAIIKNKRNKLCRTHQQ